MPAAMGTGHRINKRTSHITLVLAEKVAKAEVKKLVKEVKEVKEKIKKVAPDVVKSPVVKKVVKTKKTK